jgi:hypothetical protein
VAAERERREERGERREERGEREEECKRRECDKGEWDSRLTIPTDVM